MSEAASARAPTCGFGAAERPADQVAPQVVVALAAHELDRLRQGLRPRSCPSYYARPGGREGGVVHDAPELPHHQVVWGCGHGEGNGSGTHGGVGGPPPIAPQVNVALAAHKNSVACAGAANL